MEKREGIGLEVIKEFGNNECLFAFKWYTPDTFHQDISCYTYLWYNYFSDIKIMYIPFKYKGVYQLVHNEEFKL